MSTQNIDAQGAYRNQTVSAYPFLTSSTYTGGAAVEHTFGGFFANALIAKNTGTSGEIYIGFTSAGMTTSTYFSLKAGEELAVPTTFASVFVSGSTASQGYTLFCGVTQLKTDANLTDWDSNA